MRDDGNVLVGVDGGPLDPILVGWAAEEALARDSGLVVYHVREQPEPTQRRAAEQESPGSSELLVRDAAAMARARIPDLAVATAMGADRVGAALVKASLEARMMVVGAQGAGGRGQPVGSVAEHVATHARSPVAVVRRPASDELVDVVVGVDGSSHSDLTLRLAATQAHRFGGRLLVIHSYRLPPPAEYGPNAGVDEPHHRANAEELLERSLAQLGPARSELKIESRAVHGGAAAALLDAAAGAAVVVVGARGMGGLAGLALGSVSHHVVRQARCTVLVAR